MGMLTQLSILALLCIANLLCQDHYEFDPEYGGSPEEYQHQGYSEHYYDIGHEDEEAPDYDQGPEYDHGPESEHSEEAPVVHLPTFQYALTSEYMTIDFPYPSDCAFECNCPYNIPYAMFCNSRNIKAIPRIPAHIRYLYLQFNNIEAVPAKAFLNATNLREINLSHNNLKSSMIEAGAFSKLKFLKHLHLQYNKLDEFPMGLPTSLERLFLGFNKISKVSRDSMQGLVNITMLDLCGNELSDAAFKGKTLSRLKNLMQLNLCSNQIKSLNMELPHSLLYLSLENNSIASVAEDYFMKTPNLTILRLSRNKLEEVPFKAFNLSNLLELNLDRNKLRKIFYIPSSLQHLLLQYNEIESIDDTLLCPVTETRYQGHLTYLRLDQNKLRRSPSGLFLHRCFPFLHNIFIGEQRIVITERPPPVIRIVTEIFKFTRAPEIRIIQEEFTVTNIVDY
ncbi:osteomodulin [Protopterus annectens]|uniref:osteomodulin n=1 Tax=Protopterus annectens TaxID=7888 RepID=UPI001CFA43E3|nr:osteomodulin [Protopterus annectens]